MTLINASILAGAFLAALPIVLHLIMRAKPKRIEFPALRLLQSRQTSNSRRMRVRHILLLVLRAIVIIIAVMALTRPSLPAARYGLRWYEWLALVIVIVGCVLAYRWLSLKAAAVHAAEHQLREKRGRLRLFTVLGGVLAALLFVGLPWGLRVRAELTSPRSPVAPDIPVAAVFVFDNSLSMTYRHESKTRLEHAEQIALNHLSVLPDRSRVAVTTQDLDSEAVFQADLAGVRSRIQDLKTRAITRSLNTVLKDAIESHVADREQVQLEIGGGDAFAREIYLLTDLSVASWDDPDESGLHDLLVQHDWLQVYLIDVSVANPINVSLGQLRLDRQSTVTGQSVNVSVAVSATAAAPAEVALELFTIDEEGNELRGGAGGGASVTTVRFQGSPPVARFAVRGAQGSDAERGYIRLSTPDPMTIDDIRYFTFGVSSVPKVLLVGDRDIDTWLFRMALQPEGSGIAGDQRFDCKTITGSSFRREELRNYDIVCLLNWSHPDPSAWSSLNRFVNQGGGLFVVVGGEQDLDVAGWSSPDAQKILPGIPLTSPRFRPDAAQLNMVAEDNPIVRSFVEDKNALTELSFALFDKSWTLELAEESRVLMEYNDRSRRPALLERQVGRGRVVMFTSAMDNSDGWNEGLISFEPWAFLMLVDLSMQYLTGASEIERNFTVGEAIEIAVPESRRFVQYRVRRPRSRSTEGTFPFDQKTVLLTDIDEAGLYQLRSADEGNAFTSDFAANDLDSESDLTTISDEMLTKMLGEKRYARVTDPQELDRAVSLGRLGVEVFPVLMGLLIMLFCSEHLMANFFYDEEPTE